MSDKEKPRVRVRLDPDGNVVGYSLMGSETIMSDDEIACAIALQRLAKGPHAPRILWLKPEDFKPPRIDTPARVPSANATATYEAGRLDGVNHERTRLKLWAHIVSEHANIISPFVLLEDMLDYHSHEHNGPGGIRNHSESARTYNLKKIGDVLSEADDIMQGRNPNQPQTCRKGHANVWLDIKEEIWTCRTCGESAPNDGGRSP